jgi:hypothetical protein
MITVLLILVIIPVFIAPCAVYLVRVHDFGILKAFAVAIAILVGAMLLCVEDVRASEDCSDVDSGPACGIECGDYIVFVRDVEVNGQIEVQVKITEFMFQNPTDMALMNYNRCLLSYLEVAERTHGKKAYGRVLNHRPKTPPQPRIISYEKAMELAFDEPADPEALGYAAFGFWPDWDD